MALICHQTAHFLKWFIILTLTDVFYIIILKNYQLKEHYKQLLLTILQITLSTTKTKMNNQITDLKVPIPNIVIQLISKKDLVMVLEMRWVIYI